MSKINPGIFDQIIAADAPLMLDPDMGLGEWIVYTPAAGNSGGGTIAAVVNRASALNIDGAMASSFPSITITVAVQDVLRVNLNGDTVTLPARIGEAPQVLTVTGIISQDAGAWHLQLAGAK